LLLRKFFATAKDLLAEKGQVHVALRDSTFYSTWDLPEQARLNEYQLVK
jgi:hypothetical protein